MRFFNCFYKFLAVVSLLALIPLVDASAQQSTAQLNFGSALSVTPQNQTVTTEIAVLKAQLATMQSFTDSIVTTVYWSLGSVVVIAGLLVGFGWFTSIRMHDREIAAIRSELTSTLATQLAKSAIDLDRLLKKELTDLKNGMREIAFSAAFEKTEVLNSITKNLSEVVDRQGTEIQYVKFSTSAWHWENLNVPANALTQYHALLGLAARKGDGVHVSTSLKKLTEIVESGTRLHVSTITDLTSLLDTLPADYEIPASALRAALRKAPTY